MAKFRITSLVLFICYFTSSPLFAQDSYVKATLAITLNDAGEQKSFSGFAGNFKQQTGFDVIARCEHLHLLLLSYDATVYRDEQAVLTYLKSKGIAFEVRSGVTEANMAQACKQSIHQE